MIGKFRQTIQEAGGLLKEQALSLGDAAKAKGSAIVNEWIANIPGMEKLGLTVSYFSLGVSISPVLEVELQGMAEDFSVERLREIVEEVKGNTPLSLVFTSVKSARQLYERAELQPINPLTVRLRVRLSPEIKVSFGIPICE